MDCLCETFDGHYLKSCTNILVCGCTNSGKTFLASELVANFKQSFPDSGPLNKVVICYSSFQPIYEKMIVPHVDKCKVELFNGFPAAKLADEQFWAGPEGSENILVLDDMQNQFNNPESAAALDKLWTVMSHHCSITCIAIIHDLFGKNLKLLKIHTSYFFLLKGGVQGSLHSLIQKQFFTGNHGLINKAAKSFYGDLNSRYFMVDCSLHNCQSRFKIRTGVLPSEHGCGYAFIS